MLDFDGFDPRLGAVGGADAGSAGGAATTTSSNGGAGGHGGEASDGGGGQGAGGAAAGGAGGAGGEGGSEQVVTYLPMVADCVDPSLPDPDACASDQPLGTMGVDSDVGMLVTRHSYLRFDLDEQLAGLRVTEVLLEITVSDHDDAESSSSGEIWQVEPFTRADLFVAAPAAVGPTALVGDNGAVAQLQTVVFALPVALVMPGAPVFLGVLPLETDGIDYWNLDGATPPRLVVTAQ